MSRRKGRSWAIVALGLTMAAAGFLQLKMIDPPSGRAHAYFMLEAKGLFQVGALVALAGFLLLLLGRFSMQARDRVGGFLRRVVPKAFVFGLVFFLVGEGALRLLYADGMSFGSGGGPMDRRFNRDVQLNLYGGRGPGAAGPKKAGETRILFVGDSIMWGQGVKSDGDLVSSRTVAALGGGTTGAAICKQGREIDFHAAMIKRWGAEVAPDAIVYQWFINDCEIETTAERPHPSTPWTGLFFWPVFRSETYLGQLMHVQLYRLAPAKKSYVEYLDEQLKPGAPAWVAFEKNFRDWAGHAKSLTPRVVVMLYPKLVPDGSVSDGIKSVHARIRALCDEFGFECLDLRAAEPESFVFQKTLASPFDAHPNAETHAVMARLLTERLVERWPELGTERSKRE